VLPAAGEGERAASRVPPPAAPPALWHVPACVLEGTAAGQPARAPAIACSLLETERGLVRLDAGAGGQGGGTGSAAAAAAPCPAFVYANAGENGYYRVQIGRDDLRELAGPAKT